MILLIDVGHFKSQWIIKQNEKLIITLNSPKFAATLLFRVLLVLSNGCSTRWFTFQANFISEPTLGYLISHIINFVHGIPAGNLLTAPGSKLQGKKVATNSLTLPLVLLYQVVNCCPSHDHQHLMPVLSYPQCLQKIIFYFFPQFVVFPNMSLSFLVATSVVL